MNTESIQVSNDGLEKSETHKGENIGSHATRVTTEGAVIDEVTGEEVEPVVTFKTWIVVMILSCGYGLSFWPIPVMANIGGLIATSFDQPTSYVWYIPAWTISITCCFMICGANTDLLGRRWFLVGGNLVSTVGHIVVATAKGPRAVIAGMAIAGFGGGNCQMAAFALPELLPNKWRHIGVVIADFTTVIAVIVGPISGLYGFHEGSWQWNFGVAAIAQFLSFLGLLFMYFPPAHPYGIPPRQLLREIDYVGMFLFVAGAVPVLVGIVWTTVFPSDDAHVVAALVIGFAFIVAFALWEIFSKTKHPLTPTYVFTSSWGRDFTAPAIALAVVNMFYYSSSIIWPTIVISFYTNGGVNWRYAMALSLPQGTAITFGAILLSVFGSKIKRWHWQLTGSVFVMVLFGSLLALVTPTNKGLMVAMVFLSQTGYGWAIYLSIAVAQMGVEHKDLGLSGGIAGVSRFAAGSIAAAVYTTILSNETTKSIAKLVPAAAIAAGLPVSSIPDLMKVVGTPALAKNFSPEVVAAVGAAVAQATVHGLRLVAFASLAFGCVGIIACLCCKDVDKKMNNKVCTLHHQAGGYDG
ncbi:MFS general substrate transporter [Paraphaeosphaeria sporulosa]|uniref:MFS general substrate transporter n=1 Tax=Paraphaeosphaeria sporulosa TaxID=1460663 RepID=A0A177CSK2_9PLEO|nr:MFS general substrate transporter [Paraphaeosphaeria sporulosa]OAG09948.1 MFS general substrate transporter [Paraphaeosphaeria sporulosa]